MLILSCNISDDKIYTLSMKLDNGLIEKVSIMKDGLYSVCYVDCKHMITRNGKILKVAFSNCDRDRYILFDSSEDNMNRRERIYFDQIKFIKDITPIDAYRIALKHGFKGTVEEWLKSLEGKTPIAGVDYWTDEDKNALKEDINEMVKTEVGSINTELSDAVESVKESISTIEEIKEEASKLVEEANSQVDRVSEHVGKIEDTIKDSVTCHSSERLEGESDEDVIDRVMDGKEPKLGDSLIIKTFSEENGTYNYIKYTYYDSWEITDTGSVDADNVIINENLVITDENGKSEVINTKGKSIYEVLNMVLNKEIEPTIEQPRASVTLTDAGMKEVGSIFIPNYSAFLSAGSYSFGPDTGINAIEWKITDSNGNTSSNPTGSFEPIIVTDDTEYYVTVEATHGDGAMPVTNLKNNYPEGKIVSGTKVAVSTKVTGYRSFFYGDNADPIELNSDNIRKNLTNGGKLTSKEFSIKIHEGTNQVVIAVPNNKSVTSIIDTGAFGINIVSCFELLEVQIGGMSGYNAIPYNVYVYNPAVSLSSSEYKITIE